MSLQCKGCGAKLIIKGVRSLDKVKQIDCRRCGTVNPIYKKPNGKFRVS